MSALDKPFSFADFPVFESNACPDNTVYMLANPKMKMQLQSWSDMGPFTEAEAAPNASNVTLAELERTLSPLLFGLKERPKMNATLVGLRDSAEPEQVAPVAAECAALHPDMILALFLLAVGLIGSAVYWLCVS